MRRFIESDTRSLRSGRPRRRGITTPWAADEYVALSPRSGRRKHRPARSAHHFFFATFDFAAFLCAVFAERVTRALAGASAGVAGAGDRA
jgi:hypothetical protein